jgi:hypothetical protein
MPLTADGKPRSAAVTGIRRGGFPALLRRTLSSRVIGAILLSKSSQSLKSL